MVPSVLVRRKNIAQYCAFRLFSTRNLVLTYLLFRAQVVRSMQRACDEGRRRRRLATVGNLVVCVIEDHVSTLKQQTRCLIVSYNGLCGIDSVA